MRLLRIALIVVCLPGLLLAQGPDFSGRWQISLQIPGATQGLPLWILELTPKAGSYAGRFIAKAMPDSPEAPSAIKVAGDQIEFDIVTSDVTVHFKGKLAGGTIQGTADDKRRPLNFTAVRTTKGVLEDPMAEGRAYSAAIANREPRKKAEALEKFIRTYPQSRMLAGALAHILEATLSFEKDDAVVAATLDRFLAEFEKLPTLNDLGRFAAYRDAAHTLATRGRLLARAEELLVKAEKILGSQPAPLMRSTVLATRGILALRLNQTEQAEKYLIDALKDNPLDNQAALELARLYESQGKHTEAASHYLDVYAASPTPALLRSLEDSYLKGHGSLRGLHAELDRRLRQQPALFDPGKHAPTVASDRTVLAELFTGSECGPCFAADKAFDAMLERYPRLSVAVLEYHLHIPRADPMTNRDSEQRGDYYAVNSTPTAFFDGTVRVPSGGGPGVADQVFQHYRSEVEKALAKPPIYKIKLSTERQGDRIQARVELSSGAADTSKHRLHVALLEDPVHYTGYNRIHFHRYVVRKMLGGASGAEVRLKDGMQHWNGTFDLGEIEKEIKNYIEGFERDTNVKFSERTDAIDRDSLSLVAFVQDDGTKAILQSAFAKLP